jgi:hypothetical protein
MSESRAAGWPSGSPTAAQLKEFFSQIESGKINKERLQSFLRAKTDSQYQLMRHIGIEELELGVRSYNAMKRVGIETIGDLVDKTEADLREIPNFIYGKAGDKYLEEIREQLAKHGLALAMEPEEAARELATELGDPRLLYIEPMIDVLFELCRLLDAKCDLTLKIALREAIFVSTTSRHDRDLAARELMTLKDELSDTCAEINALTVKIAGRLVDADFGGVR